MKTSETKTYIFAMDFLKKWVINSNKLVSAIVFLYVYYIPVKCEKLNPNINARNQVLNPLKIFVFVFTFQETLLELLLSCVCKMRA